MLNRLQTLIQGLQTESSTLVKEDMLLRFFKEANPADESDLDVFKMIIDPTIKFGLAKKSIDKALTEDFQFGLIHTYKDNISNDELMLDFLTRLSNKTLTGKQALAEFVHFFTKCQLNEPDQQFLIDILIGKPIGLTINTVNDIYVKLHNRQFINQFKCQLANKYVSTKNYNVDHFYASPKLDGVRAIYKDGKLYTRQNREIKSCPNILKHCQLIDGDFSVDFIDGELYSDKLSFNEIQGTVANVKPNDEHLEFRIFAVGHKKITNTESMVNFIDKNFDNRVKQSNGKLWIVPQTKIMNEPRIVEVMHQEYVNYGYEGLMLRHPENCYNHGRNNDLLKVKSFLSDEFKVIGYFEGSNRLANTFGGFQMESLDKSIKFNLGSGFTDKDRKTIWLDPDSYIGKTIEVKYFELCEDSKTKQVSLRFPVFMRMKNVKD